MAVMARAGGGDGPIGVAAIGLRAGSDGPGGEQLGQVVGGADERPLGRDLGEAAQQELAEAAPA